VKSRDAHSLPLETLGELGAVGMVFLLGFVGAVAIAARRSISGKGVVRPAEAAAVTAGFVVWLAHASVDWAWEMPVLTGVPIVLCATLFQRGGGAGPGLGAPRSGLAWILGRGFVHPLR